jgi:hypothetical protein
MPHPEISGIINITVIVLFLEGASLDSWDFHSLSTAWAMTPLLAYPFLPSGGLFSIPCEVFLIWPTGLGIVHLFSGVVLDWFYDQPSSHPWQFWQLPLMWITLLAGFDRALSQSRDELNDKPNEERFCLSSDYVDGSFYLAIAQAGASGILTLPDEGSWPRYLFRLLCLLIEYTALTIAFVVWKYKIHLTYHFPVHFAAGNLVDLAS